MNRFKKPASIKGMSLVLSLFTLLAYHYPVFNYAATHVESGWNAALIIGCSAAIMLALNFMIYYALLFLGRIVGKIVLSFTFIGNAVALYFINTYEVLITDKMMGNVFNTRYSEASAFFSTTAVLYLLLLGVVPCLYIFLRRVDYGSFRRFARNAGVALLITLGSVVVNMPNFTWVDRHASKVGSLLMPWSYVVNTVRYHNRVSKANRKEIKLPDATIASSGRDLCVLIIGESARRDHFSLYGYERETNPQLKGDGVTALLAKAAATYTTEGVKAILSHKASNKLYEILPNYLHRTGVDVVWRTNNWGEPPLHIEKCYTPKKLKQKYPELDGRYDGFLLEGLIDEVEACDKEKQLIVLHTSTSHGPSYYQKYPAEFEQFKPVCTTVEMSKSNREELINAYDNTILYTDHLVHSVIEALRGLEGVRSCVLYVSDHGESLGENNLYMHGVPMMMAPAEQIEIPFLVWSSDTELEVEAEGEIGQYHVFHSVLHFLGVESPIFDDTYNIFSGGSR
ncbi:MAG: phosphoethanolamine--lipid A transferase EptA [Alistipes sp.]|nr:phosphoethanolamine--lipid A transferase EptA [Alistipes sp.]